MKQVISKNGVVHIQSGDAIGVYEPTQLGTLMRRYEKVMDTFDHLSRTVVKVRCPASKAFNLDDGYSLIYSHPASMLHHASSGLNVTFRNVSAFFFSCRLYPTSSSSPNPTPS